MTRMAFVDVETTGLDPERHAPWEIAIVVREVDGSEREYLWQVRPDLSVADLKSLEVGRFWSRFQLDRLEGPFGASAAEWCDGEPGEELSAGWVRTDHHRVAMDVARVLAGAHVAGANPAFDAAMLTRWLRYSGAPAPVWHHRLIDVEAYAAGAVQWPEPRSLSDTAERLGIAVDRDQQHGALYDAHLAKQVYDATVAFERPAVDVVDCEIVDLEEASDAVHS